MKKTRAGIGIIWIFLISAGTAFGGQGQDNNPISPLMQGRRPEAVAVSGEGFWDDRFFEVDGEVNAIAENNGILYAGGLFTCIGGIAANSVAKWDGTTWSALGSGVNDVIYALATSGTDLYAGVSGGSYLSTDIYKWDGTTWTGIHSGYGGHIKALAFYGTDLYAVGYWFTKGSGTPWHFFIKWDGTTWSTLDSGPFGGWSALAVSGTDLYVGGNFTEVGGISANHIAKWNGTTWSALGTGISGGGVSTLAVFGPDLFVGGSFTEAGGVSANYIAKWSGTSWSALGSGMTGSVNALAVLGSDLYAGGYFTTAGGVTANGIAEWDGTTWSALGTVSGYVSALAVSGPDLYAGGDFTAAGGVSSSHFAIWHKNLILTSPLGGEFWVAGTAHPITWAAQPIVGAVKLEYSIDGGTNWTTIIASTPNDGSYDWVVPNSLSAMCLVRVSDAVTGISADISTEVFSIVLSLPPAIRLSRSRINYGVSGGISSPIQSVLISNAGGGAMNWTGVPSDTWITLSPQSGTGDGLVNIGVNPSGLSGGNYTGTVLFSDPNATNSGQVVSVHLRVYGGGDTAGSLGSFDTPIDGTIGVTGAIPVTGWALDDIEVTGVKIYRNPINGEPAQPNDLVYIGDAFFVEGARPDVETAYPGYPLNYRAGWGYMMLTNFLPAGGNGTFTLHAIATDKEGNQIDLGQKTITCNNLAAVKPFGTIDTPAQGGTISGSGFVNFGWALTPQPKSIPIDGSTITVWVDGLPLGHPMYNNYRPDIATLFPGYNNSNGAVGYYYLDTTGYSNGRHTIEWSVADSDGAVDGIGSRYFQILNAGSGPAAGWAEAASSSNAGILGGTSNRQFSSGFKSIEEIQDTISDMTSPVLVRRGYNFDRPAEPIYPNPAGSINVLIPELERAAIYLDPSQAFETREELEARGRSLFIKNFSSLSPKVDSFTRRFEAYLLVGTELCPLPIGTTFDTERGVLYWQPGPGFLGEYTVVFVEKDDVGLSSRQTVKIMIVPKGGSER